MLEKEKTETNNVLKSQSLQLQQKAFNFSLFFPPDASKTNRVIGLYKLFSEVMLQIDKSIS